MEGKMGNTYAQNDEDAFVLQYFDGYVGNLLSIGENDGITFSNAKLLIEHNWEAWLLEPGRICGDLQYLHRGNDKVHVFHYGIGEKDEHVPFWDSDEHVPNGKDKGLVSTTNFEETKRWPDVNFTPITIQLVTFANFYKYADSPRFDFISIDAEGADWSILQQIDLDKVACSCLCIEHNGHESLIRSYREYCEDKYRMKQALINGENIIFTR